MRDPRSAIVRTRTVPWRSVSAPVPSGRRMGLGTAFPGRSAGHRRCGPAGSPGSRVSRRTSALRDCEKGSSGTGADRASRRPPWSAMDLTRHAWLPTIRSDRAASVADAGSCAARPWRLADRSAVTAPPGHRNPKSSRRAQGVRQFRCDRSLPALDSPGEHVADCGRGIRSHHSTNLRRIVRRAGHGCPQTGQPCGTGSPGRERAPTRLTVRAFIELL